MYGSGVLTGTEPIHLPQMLIQEVRIRDPPVCCAAAAGTATLGIAAFRIATTTRPGLVAIAMASASLVPFSSQRGRMATTEQVYLPRFALNITQAAEIGHFSCYFCHNCLA
jgi:hypothetical protein